MLFQVQPSNMRKFHREYPTVQDAVWTAQLFAYCELLILENKEKRSIL